MPVAAPRSILFICMGNICRSPTVEAVARRRFAAAGLAIEVASAGTEDYHIGDGADRRSIRHARTRGYDLDAHRARQVVAADFARHDHLLVMDRVNLRTLLAMAPAGASDRIALFLPFAGNALEELPDPYYGDAAGFERVIDLAEAGVDALVRGWLGHNRPSPRG